MPRTPFTAKKSTGAPADRVELDAVVPPLKPKPKPYSRASTPPVKGNAQVLVKVRKGENEVSKKLLQLYPMTHGLSVLLSLSQRRPSHALYYVPSGIL